MTEAFTYGQLQERLERYAPEPRNKFVDGLYADEERKATGSWDAAKKAFNTWGPGVQLGEFKRWNEVLAVIDARNAVVHGLGQFTRLQRRKHSALAESKKRLVKLGYAIDESDNRLITTSVALRNTGDLLRQFLEHLDGQLTAHP
ncbi:MULTISPECIES: hypothetical protein [unclassified Nocardioides]|uniref:hypothetical protein n=1 Tax=unclassified Nocardioides TaxID=2615069 RepID=UPI003014A990